VPDSSVAGTLYGFNEEAIPEAKDVVRVDLVGGFALQKCTSERSYFRTIANMDVKVDFVPPSLINFISRQLIGNGFRLYQKVVASVMSQDKEEFSKALGDPLYARIREAQLALETLDKAISMVREYRLRSPIATSSFANEESPCMKKYGRIDSFSIKTVKPCDNNEVSVGSYSLENGAILDQATRRNKQLNADLVQDISSDDKAKSRRKKKSNAVVNQGDDLIMVR
ncbi:hypothetical protein RYX36_035803, partial [Vicia faba]